eukprot:TRINITY_DN8009_c0_g1_i1.p1 TRINITY_DN8009_c0_g1~~TRINITY_DN8009_c0_g1_i1.p1  ORF type:complete len:367 (+),score=53.14 TRINITY_DN8009_c0_g1_i1:130-1101(+)
MDIQEYSISGAIVTVLVSLVIGGLILTELIYYQEVIVRYEYGVDTDIYAKMNLTLDMTIKMPCDYLGVDYIDVSGTSIDASQFMTLEPAHFELAPNQQEWLDHWASYKAQEGSRGLDSLNRFLHGSLRPPMPDAAPEIGTPPEDCRIHGTMPVARVASNFHITAGKSIHHSRGHSHMALNIPPEKINFSHRIDRFSFSEEQRGGMSLDGDVKTTDSNRQVYQYYLKVVPSTTKRLGQDKPLRSNQYSVTEQHRQLQPHARGLPGVYFKYEIEPVGVHVHEEHRSLSSFIIRMCGIIGGIVATSGMLHQCLSALLQKKEESLET